MKITELIKEEISLTKYGPNAKEAIKQGLADSLNVLYTRFKKHNGERYSPKSFDDDDGDYKNFVVCLKNDLFFQATHTVGARLRELAASIEPYYNDVGDTVSFIQTNVDGYASGLTIVINETYLQEITTKIIYNLVDAARNSYNQGERLDGLWNDFVKNAIDRKMNDRVSLEGLDDGVKSNINKIVDIFIHELVHTIQHTQQYKKTKSPTYTSYLGKTKDFNKLHDLKLNDKLPPEETEKYQSMYLASPQEIAAHAHNIALEFIHSWGLDDTDPENLNSIIRNITEYNGIVDSIDSYLRNRFKGATDKRTQQVYKRYMKLVYNEVMKYIQHLKQKSNI
jgi:hypothetical protein